MLRKLTMLPSLAIVIGLMTGPAFALSIPGMKHHVTGNVTAVDPDAKSVTVTDDRNQKSFSFDVKDRAMLSGVKKGERVRVGYTKHGAQLTATSIVPQSATKSSSPNRAAAPKY